MTAADIRAAILASDDLPREPVDVPWETGGAKVYIRGMTSTEKDAWIARTMPDGGTFRWTPNLTAELVVKTLVDEDGERIFTDADAPALGGKGAPALGALFAVAMRLSGLQEDEVEVVEADLGTAPAGPSSTV